MFKDKGASTRARKKKCDKPTVSEEVPEADESLKNSQSAESPMSQTEFVTTSAQEADSAVLELAALKDRYTRLLADFDNYRKRQARDSEGFVKHANANLLGDLLPVVDHMELALAKVPNADDPFVIGVQLVYDQMLALLKRYNMTPVDARGQPFDPDYHEALSQTSSATVPAHTVIEQFRRGWMLAGRLLRPAQVIVSSGFPDQEEAQSEADCASD